MTFGPEKNWTLVQYNKSCAHFTQRTRPSADLLLMLKHRLEQLRRQIKKKLIAQCSESDSVGSHTGVWRYSIMLKVNGRKGKHIYDMFCQLRMLVSGLKYSDWTRWTDILFVFQENLRILPLLSFPVNPTARTLIALASMYSDLTQRQHNLMQKLCLIRYKEN